MFVVCAPRKRQHNFRRLFFYGCPDIRTVQESKLSSEARLDQALKLFICSHELERRVAT